LPSESASCSEIHESAPPLARKVGLWQVLFVLLSLEVGIFLAAGPWTVFWGQNLLAGRFAFLRPYLLSYSVRGGFTGLGLINLWIGVEQVFRWWRLSARDRAGN
jgi:hypothetical protein